MDPKYKLIAQLLYGSGLRLMEAVRLRVKDVDYDYVSLMIWQGKGNKNRRVTLALELLPLLRSQSHSTGQCLFVSPLLFMNFSKTQRLLTLNLFVNNCLNFLI